MESIEDENSKDEDDLELSTGEQSTDTFAGIEESTDALELDTPSKEDEKPKEEPASRKMVSPPKDPLKARLFKILGGQIVADLESDQWKVRGQVVAEVENLLMNWNQQESRQSSESMFEGGLILASIAIGDKVQQVFFAALSLIRKLLQLPTIPVPKSCHNTTDPPQYLHILFSALFYRTGSSNERSAGEAHQCLLALAFDTPIGCQFLASRILQDSGGETRADNWRPLRARLVLIIELIKRNAIRDSGIKMGDILAMALPALENASVKVRQAAIVVLAFTMEPLSHGTDNEKLEQFLQQQLGSGVKSAVLTTLAKQVLVVRRKRAEQTQKEPVSADNDPFVRRDRDRGRGRGRDRDRDRDMSRRREGSANGDQHSDKRGSGPGPREEEGGHGGLEGGGGGGGGDVGELPYAEPLSEELAEGEAACVVQVFGEDLARCQFSADWASREAALKHAGAMIKQGTGVGQGPEAAVELLHACHVQLSGAFTDRVLHVYVAGLKMLQQLLKATERDEEDVGLASCMASLFPLLVRGLGDSKPKKRKGAEAVLLRMCRHVQLGPTYVLVEFVRTATAVEEAQQQQQQQARASGGGGGGGGSPSRRGGGAAESGQLTSSRLLLVSKILADYGLYDDASSPNGPPSEDAPGALPLSQVITLAVLGLEHRDKATRRASLSLFEELCRHEEEATLPYILNLKTLTQKKLLKRLVEAGVLPEELLQEEQEPSYSEHQRPTTSICVRPGTAAAMKGLRPTLNAAMQDGPQSPTNSKKTVTNLPHAPPLSEDETAEFEGMIALYGEPLVRCLMDRAWASREAALKEVQIHLCAPADGGSTMVAPGDPRVLMITSELLEVALADTVARVYLTGLGVLEALASHYLPTVPGGAFLARAGLQPALSQVTIRLGDSKERVRLQSEQVMLSLARLKSVGCRLVAGCVVDMKGNNVQKAAASVLKERLMILERLVREFGMSMPAPAAAEGQGEGGGGEKKPRKRNKALTLDFDEILSLVVPSFENRHVDVRNAAVKVYTAIYEVTEGGKQALPTLDLQSCLEGLNPAMRASISECVVRFNTIKATIDSDNGVGGSGSGGGSGSDEGGKERMAGIHQVSKEKLTEMFGADIAESLGSGDWRERRRAILDASDKLLGRMGGVASVAIAKAQGWELCSLILKQGLMDRMMQVRLVVYDLLHIMSNTQMQTTDSPIAFPWDNWDARLLLGSTVKSIADRLGDDSVRVRSATIEALAVLARQHEVGCALVSRQILAIFKLPPVPERGGSDQRAHHARIAYARAARLLLGRLSTCIALLGEFSLPATGNPLALDSVLAFIALALTHYSPMVRKLAIDACSVACEMGGKGAVQSYLANADHATLRVLRPLCAKLVPGIGDAPPSNSNGCGHVRIVDGAGGSGSGSPRARVASPGSSGVGVTIAGSPRRTERGVAAPPRPNLMSPHALPMNSPSLNMHAAPSPIRLNRARQRNTRDRDGDIGGGMGGGMGTAQQVGGLQSGDWEAQQADMSRKPWSVPAQEKPFTPNTLQPPSSAHTFGDSGAQGGLDGTRFHGISSRRREPLGEEANGGDNKPEWLRTGLGADNDAGGADENFEENFEYSSGYQGVGAKGRLRARQRMLRDQR